MRVPELATAAPRRTCSLLSSSGKVVFWLLLWLLLWLMLVLIV